MADRINNLVIMFEDLMRDGIRIIPRTDEMPGDFGESLQVVVDRVMNRSGCGRTATVTDDGLCIVITLDPLPGG